MEEKRTLYNKLSEKIYWSLKKDEGSLISFNESTTFLVIGG